jgi:hypothetical protein
LLQEALIRPKVILPSSDLITTSPRHHVVIRVHVVSRTTLSRQKEEKPARQETEKLRQRSLEHQRSYLVTAIVLPVSVIVSDVIVASSVTDVINDSATFSVSSARHEEMGALPTEDCCGGWVFTTTDFDHQR